MKSDNRVYHNQFGKILFMTGEISGVEHAESEEVSYLDIPAGSFDYNRSIIMGVDVGNGKLITEILEVEETEDQKRIRELEEDLILMRADAELGGIL